MPHLRCIRVERFGGSVVRALFVIVCGCVLLIGAQAGLGRAGVTPKARITAMELIVFEHPDCIYCAVFRRDVASNYQNSAPAAEAPLRYVDIAKSDIAALRLKEGIDMVPTAVLMKNGEEVGRISGYWGREGFFKMLAHIRSTAE
jgi:thioredoxin-related protein